MSAITIVTLISSFSFFFYAFSYFRTPHMKNEFKRFGLEKIGLATVLLEIIGKNPSNRQTPERKQYLVF